MATDSSDTSTRTKSVASPVAKSAPPSPAASPAGSYVSHGHGVAAGSVAVSLSLKRFKLASIAVAIVSAIVAFMVFFQRGVTLKEVDLIASEANEVSQKKLLDDYNSYTGIASSAITTPIEMFTTMALQLTMLRFVAKSLLAPETSERVDKIKSLAAFVLVFLVLNGFSALNVQLEPRGIKPVVSLSDLVLEGTGNASTNSSAVANTRVAMDSNVTYIVPETTEGNLVTNTLLRTAVVPRLWETMGLTRCGSSSAGSISKDAADQSIEFGFPIRSWNSRMLPVALTPKTMAISLLNDTTASAPQAAQFPMNASVAAELVLVAMSSADSELGWFKNGSFPINTIDPASVPKGVPLTVSLPRATGMLPPTDSRDEMKEREWFLKEVPRLLKNKFNEPKGINDTESGVSLNFSHVDLSDHITFDAVTIEAAVDTDQYTTAVDADNKTRYFSWLDPTNVCGPKPLSVCGVRKAVRFKKRTSGTVYDTPSKIVLGGFNCLSPVINYFWAEGSFFTQQKCNLTSNSSTLVVSIAKRIVADSVLEQANARTEKLTGLKYPVLVNARKIYSITVGQLSWQTQDLAKAFGAMCDVTTGSGCQGLQFPLSSTATSGDGSDVIVASVDTLPVTAFPREIVRVREPLKSGESFSEMYDSAAGDLLLPHNLLVDRTRKISETSCQVRMDTRLQIALGNHLYMEDGLQPAYTAAMFYLFQNGVVKKSVNLVTTDKSSTATKTLSFDKNIQTSALVASIPLLNVYQSLVGCALLAIGVLATLFSSGSILSNVGDSDDANDSNTNNSKNANNTNTNNPLEDSNEQHLAKVSDPRVVAQVMLNEVRFPPMFLQRTLTDTSGHFNTAEMATFEISSMTLNTEGDDSKRVVLDKKFDRSNGVV